MKCFLIQVKWWQICVFISLSVVYTQHWDCFRHCEGDNWFFFLKGPSSHLTLFSSFTSFFSNSAKIKSLIRQSKDIKTLLVISLISHASHFSFSLKQCTFHTSEFSFHVQDAITYFSQGIISSYFIFAFQIASIHHLKLWTFINLHRYNKCMWSIEIISALFKNHQCISVILAPGIEWKSDML